MSVGCTRGCPAGVRPGTPPCFCLLCCMCVPRPSLGVQGALVARLLDPLPLGRPGLFARISRKPDARCHSLRPKGKGYRPCTPTNRSTDSSTSSPNISAVRPRRWGEQAGSPTSAVCCFVDRPMRRSLATWPFHPMSTVRVFQGDADGVSLRCSGHGSVGTAFCLFPPICMEGLKLNPQEVSYRSAESCWTFCPTVTKPFVATRTAMEQFGESTIFRCLLQLQEEARCHDGLDYLQVFEDQGTHEELWFIEDGEGGAITALLPDDY